jgi:hypothetical protein
MAVAATWSRSKALTFDGELHVARAGDAAALRFTRARPSKTHPRGRRAGRNDIAAAAGMKAASCSASS